MTIALLQSIKRGNNWKELKRESRIGSKDLKAHFLHLT